MCPVYPCQHASLVRGSSKQTRTMYWPGLLDLGHGLGHVHDNSKLPWYCQLNTGIDMAFPVLIAPMAMQCMAYPGGEPAAARAAARAGIPYVSIDSTFRRHPV